MLVATPSQIDRPTKRTMEALMQQLVEANIAQQAMHRKLMGALTAVQV